MTEPLFLIAHSVRKLPAFDVAIQMKCPHCLGYPNGAYPDDFTVPGCHECDDQGYWWIIPTSGHRAYPATWVDLDCVTPAHVEMMKKSNITGLPDHYPTRTAPTVSLIDALGLRKPKAEPSTTPIARRF